jgi:hypothetical protein
MGSAGLSSARRGRLPVWSFVRIQFNPLRRITIRSLVDVIVVSKPEHITCIEGSGKVDRLHKYGTKSVPFWAKTFFKATRFYDFKRDQWFLSLESNTIGEYGERYESVSAKVRDWYTQEDVETIADLLEAKADDETLARAITQVVNRRFFGQDVPPPITRAAERTLQKMGETLCPWKYFRGRAAQKRIMAYCAKTLDGNMNLVDIGHNIGATVQTATVALRRLQKHLNERVEDIFTEDALTPVVPRIATEATDFNGLLRSDTTPGKTVLIYQIEKAAAESGEISFTFGAGLPARQCVFKDFFLAFMNDLKATLNDGASGTSTNP